MLEGDAYTRILTLLKGDKTQPLTLTHATVTSPSPISVRVDGDTVDTPNEGIIIAEHLTEHKRTVDISSSTVSASNAVLTFKSALKAGDIVICFIANDGQLVYLLDKAVI